MLIKQPGRPVSLEEKKLHLRGGEQKQIEEEKFMRGCFFTMVVFSHVTYANSLFSRSTQCERTMT